AISTSDLSYQQRKDSLIANGVAVWDVLQSCSRPGSLDANIDSTSIIVNDLNAFFTEHKQITQVYFNGAMAEKLYVKHIMPSLSPGLKRLRYRRLPSTSPAHASLTLAQKIQAWKVIKTDMVK
ncbi:MAG: DNA-deoxyinosine glycosylase, partial [Methylococcales bacterium]